MLKKNIVTPWKDRAEKMRAIDAENRKLMKEGKIPNMSVAMIREVGPSRLNCNEFGEQKTVHFGNSERMALSPASMFLPIRRKIFPEMLRAGWPGEVLSGVYEESYPGNDVTAFIEDLATSLFKDQSGYMLSRSDYQRVADSIHKAFSEPLVNDEKLADATDKEIKDEAEDIAGYVNKIAGGAGKFDMKAEGAADEFIKAYREEYPDTTDAVADFLSTYVFKEFSKSSKGGNLKKLVACTHAAIAPTDFELLGKDKEYRKRELAWIESYIWNDNPRLDADCALYYAFFGEMATSKHMNGSYGSLYRSFAIGVTPFWNEKSCVSATDDMISNYRYKHLNRNGRKGSIVLASKDVNSAVMLMQYHFSMVSGMRHMMSCLDPTNPDDWDYALRRLREISAMILDLFTRKLPKTGSGDSYTNEEPSATLVRFTDGQPYTAEGMYSDAITETEGVKRIAVERLVRFAGPRKFDDKKARKVSYICLVDEMDDIPLPDGVQSLDRDALIEVVRNGVTL